MNRKERTPFARLPTELLLEILNHVTYEERLQLGLVCKDFLKYVKDPLWWKAHYELTYEAILDKKDRLQKAITQPDAHPLVQTARIIALAHKELNIPMVASLYPKSYQLLMDNLSLLSNVNYLSQETKTKFFTALLDQSLQKMKIEQMEKLMALDILPDHRALQSNLSAVFEKKDHPNFVLYTIQLIKWGATPLPHQLNTALTYTFQNIDSPTFLHDAERLIAWGAKASQEQLNTLLTTALNTVKLHYAKKFQAWGAISNPMLLDNLCLTFLKANNLNEVEKIIKLGATVYSSDLEAQIEKASQANNVFLANALCRLK